MSDIDNQSQIIDDQDKSITFFKPDVHKISSLIHKSGYEPLQDKNPTQQNMTDFNSDVQSLSNKSSSGVTDVLQNNKIFLYMVIHEMKHPTEALQNRIDYVSS